MDTWLIQSQRTSTWFTFSVEHIFYLMSNKFVYLAGACSRLHSGCNLLRLKHQHNETLPFAIYRADQLTLYPVSSCMSFSRGQNCRCTAFSFYKRSCVHVASFEAQKLRRKVLTLMLDMQFMTLKCALTL
jgi:hypothetical protein